MTAMDPEQLRRTIARATIPLLGEYETLTTAEIARAAGIGELGAIRTDQRSRRVWSR